MPEDSGGIRMDIQSQLTEMLLKSQALLEGHFKLSSGRHSDKYLQCAKILQFPEFARWIGTHLAEIFAGNAPDGIIAPAIGGILVAHELAAALKVRAIFGEREDGKMTLRRGFEIQPRERFIVVEDVITTGKSTREIIQLVQEKEGIIVGIGAIADRSQEMLNMPCEPKALLRLPIVNWEVSECPLCQQGVPIYAPGSRFKNAS
jgi:orotate phosphoribosyltransferase